MDFEKVCMMFTMQEPFYGILLSSMIRESTKRVDTMAVGRSGNTFRLYYNPDFVARLDNDTLLECIKHEVLHVAFNHFSLWDNDFPPKEEQELRNYATDLEVNCYINTKKMKDVKPVVCDYFGFQERQGSRTYYKLLLDMLNQQKQKSQAQQPTKPCNGGQGGQQKQQQQQQQSQSGSPQQNQSQGQGQGQSQQQNSQSQTQGQGQGQGQQNNGQQASSGGNSGSAELEAMLGNKGEQFDSHQDWPKMSNEEKEETERIVEDLLSFAAEETEKGCGSIPGEMRGAIDKIRARKKPRPVADWKRYMRRYLGNEFSEFTRKSKKRESRRFPDAPGNKHKRKSHILVAIDTSGSVSMPEYIEFFGQIRTLTQVADFHIVECDARIQHEYEYKNRPNMTLHGGGGTSFRPVIDLYKENIRKYDALVYFTDGYCDIPDDTPKDTLWVISSNGDQSDRQRYRVNGASVAFIPKKEKK